MCNIDVNYEENISSAHVLCHSQKNQIVNCEAQQLCCNLPLSVVKVIYEFDKETEVRDRSFMYF
jgi:hypothetical protein